MMILDTVISRGTVYFPNRLYVDGQEPVNIQANQHPYILTIFM